MTGIYKPDSGTVRMNGRVSSLIELGAGFHPEFTGRENVFINGTILGLSRKEIEKRFDRIVRFAELESFIDVPVRTYSSGMYVRLGFSVAVNVDPDILLVDEVLAVGDESFSRKCVDKMTAFKKAGKTIVLVTHDLPTVERFCDQALWLDSGCIQAQGEPRQVIDAYRQEVARRDDARYKEEQTNACRDTERFISRSRWGNGDIEIIQVRLSDDQRSGKARLSGWGGPILGNELSGSSSYPGCRFRGSHLRWKGDLLLWYQYPFGRNNPSVPSDNRSNRGKV